MKKTSIILSVCIIILAFCLTGCANESTEKLFSEKAAVADGGNGQIAYTMGNVTVNQKPMIYLHVSSALQGQFESVKTGNDKRGTIPANDLSEGFYVPVDEESGYPVGRRVYSPTTFIHALDNTSPMFRRAASNGEYLSISADYYTFNNAGLEELYYTVTYENAIVIDVGTFTDSRGYVYESVSFVFDRVTYTYVDSNFSFTDRIH